MGGQGVRMLRAQDPLAYRQQRRELVAGGGRFPRRPGPAGELVSGGQGARVLRAADSFPCLNHSPQETENGLSAAPTGCVHLLPLGLGGQPAPAQRA